MSVEYESYCRPCRSPLPRADQPLGVQQLCHAVAPSRKGGMAEEGPHPASASPLRVLQPSTPPDASPLDTSSTLEHLARPRVSLGWSSVLALASPFTQGPRCAPRPHVSRRKGRHAPGAYRISHRREQERRTGSNRIISIALTSETIHLRPSNWEKNHTYFLFWQVDGLDGKFPYPHTNTYNISLIFSSATTQILQNNKTTQELAKLLLRSLKWSLVLPISLYFSPQEDIVLVKYSEFIRAGITSKPRTKYTVRLFGTHPGIFMHKTEDS